MANIRSEYIKNLMEDKKQLDENLQAATKETLKDIVEEQLSKSLRNMIAEAKDEDDYEEEEVESPESELTEPEETEKSEDDDVKDEEIDDDDLELSDEEDGEEDSDDADDEIWSSLEQFKGEDGEYDLTGMDSEDVVKVLKVMKPEDGVRVVKKDNGTIELHDEENDTEYIIDLEDEDSFDDDEDEFEIEIEECGPNGCGGKKLRESEIDLGYTDDYQKDSAITTDGNDEVADPKSTRSWHKGIPTGVEKPWAGNSKGKTPYTEAKDEEEFEVELDEEVLCDNEDLKEAASTVANKRTNRATKAAKGAKKRHRIETTKNPTENSENESIMRKANAVFNENKQLKAIAEQIKNKLHEACVVNSSLGKIIKLVTENTTTRDEKIDIVNRFNNVKTINEGKALYETIASELKNSHSINDAANSIVNNAQLSESKRNNIVETAMYQSEDLAQTLDLMQRLSKIK